MDFLVGEIDEGRGHCVEPSMALILNTQAGTVRQPASNSRSRRRYSGSSFSTSARARGVVHMFGVRSRVMNR